MKVFHNGSDILPHLSISCVIFRYHANCLKVLLLQERQAQPWCLPTGGIHKEESFDEALARIVRGRIHPTDIYVHQFHAFDRARRRQSEDSDAQRQTRTPPDGTDDRFITVGYMGVVYLSKCDLDDSSLQTSNWFDVNHLPSLRSDCHEIILKAINTLVLHFNDYPFGKFLLPEKFTIPELQRLYETILSKRLDRANFQKKILSLAILQRLKGHQKTGAHKPAFMYSFHPKRYALALQQNHLKLGY